MRRILQRGLPVALAIGGLALLTQHTPGVAQAMAPPSPIAVDQELPEGVTPEMVAEGELIYGDQGMCLTCHGAQGEGTPVGPNLTDGEWIQIDGSYESLVDIIESGVMEPAEYAGAMLPRGGGDISDDEVRAVAAYVWSMSR